MNTTTRHPWAWIPSLYYVEGLPYVMVMMVSTIMYKRLGISNTEIALYTSLLYLPWVLKPLWSPVVDIYRTKRWWTVITQGILALSLVGIALSLPTGNFFFLSLAFFWLLAISSATHDISADGFYMIALRDDQQAFFVGIRSTFYRLAMLSGEGLLVVLAGIIEERTGNISLSWMNMFLVAAIILAVFALYHRFILPKPQEDRAQKPEGESFFSSFIHTYETFFQKKNMLIILAFLLLYRFGEAQLVKLAGPFLLDARDVGGLGLSTLEVGYINGTVGVISLVIGGILGGILVSRHGLKYWLWPMVLALNLPNLAYVFLSIQQPDNMTIIASMVGLEKFGYGFGFTAFLMYTIYISQGTHKTAHYAFATGFMALGMMLPGMVSGWIQEQVGYVNFFLWVMIATVPAFFITAFLQIDPEFGKGKK